jgi:hypothetical protein
MAQLHDLAVARARQTACDRLKAAETALAKADNQRDTDSGIAINFTLHERVRAAEREVNASRTALRRVDPDSTE